MREARDLLLELVDDLEWLCFRADHIAICIAGQDLIDEARSRLRRVAAELDQIAPEPPPVPLWPAPAEKR